ncbi:MAG: hypothetical protein OQK49_02070 [Proteobacteria bacterium]|nr:hypothetical protein [Pseudomonadota bacterium]
MKKTLISFLCLSLSLAISAKELKRPSWSQGLPERTDSKAPELKIAKPFNEDKELTLNRTLIKPNHQTQSISVPSPNYQQQKPVIETTFSESNPPDNNHSTITVIQSKPAKNNINQQYPWNITRMAAVTAPAFWVKKYPSVHINISIQPNGQVESIREITDKPIPQALMVKIQRAIKQWRFTAPEDYGIHTNLSRPFKIQLQPDHT